MPRVPTYDEFQVAPQVAPAGRAEASVTPQMMSVSGEQMQQVGRGMQSAGDAFSKIAVDIQKDINDAVTKEADNAAAQTISQVMGDYMTRSGKDAVVTQDGAKKAIEEALRNSGQGLQNNMQRQMYGDIAMRRMQQSLGQINMHAAGQAKVWNEAETGARLGNARRDATTSWTSWDQEGGEYAVKRATMIAESDALMKIKYGADPDSEVAKAARLTQSTGLAADAHPEHAGGQPVEDGERLLHQGDGAWRHRPREGQAHPRHDQDRQRQGRGADLVDVAQGWLGV